MEKGGANPGAIAAKKAEFLSVYTKPATQQLLTEAVIDNKKQRELILRNRRVDEGRRCHGWRAKG